MTVTLRKVNLRYGLYIVTVNLNEIFKTEVQPIKNYTTIVIERVFSLMSVRALGKCNLFICLVVRLGTELLKVK